MKFITSTYLQNKKNKEKEKKKQINFQMLDFFQYLKKKMFYKAKIFLNV